MNSKKLFRPLALCLVLFAVVACEYDEYPDPIWDPDATGGSTPTITSVDPADVVYHGLSVVTITGTNFSDVMTENQVTFNGQVAEIDEAQSSATQLVVTTPLVIQDAAVNMVSDVQLLVAVQGAYAGALYDHPFTVERAVIEWGGFIGEQPAKNPTNVCSDAAENVYVAGADKILYKIDTAGERTAFATGLSSFTNDLKVGPGGYVYFTRNIPYLYRIDPTGGAADRWLRLGAKIACFDFAPDQNIYAAGKNDSIYYADIAAETAVGVALAADYEYLVLRVFDGYVYVGGSYVGDDATVTVTEGIWRHAINGDNSLGAKELVYDWANHAYADEQHLRSLVVNADGLFYIGVSEGTGPAMFTLDITSQAVEPFYDAVLFTPATKLEWGPGNNIYCARFSDTPTEEVPNGVFRISQTMQSAPYYGRD